MSQVIENAQYTELSKHHPAYSEARIRGRARRQKTFQAVCLVCNEEKTHATHSGKCLTCMEAPRKIAKLTNQSRYKDVCEIHGPGDFDVRFGHCLTCYSTSGDVRAPKIPLTARQSARAMHQTEYLDTCHIHGLGDHSVRHGKCLTCFSTTGAPRKPTRANPTRVLARNLNMPQFLHECHLHGQSEHSTAHGKCLKCFTQTGYPRRRVTL